MGLRAMKKLSSAARLFSIVGVVLSIGLTAAQAQLSRDSKSRIDITGQHFEAFEDRNYVVWTGDVVVVQSNVVLTAPKLTLFTDDSGDLSKIDATGGIRYTNGAEAISGQQAVYLAGSDIITVTGNVVVVQGDQVMSGEKLIYNLSTGKITFSSEGKGRVRGIFYGKDSQPKTSS